MSKYLLPCSCGANIPVSRSQAGMNLPCPQCGKKIEVPTIRQMSTLEAVDASVSTAKNSTSPNSLRIFAALSLIVGLVALFYGGRLFLERYSIISVLAKQDMDLSKTEDDFLADMRKTSMSFTPADTWDYWNELTTEGMVDPNPPDLFKFKRFLEGRYPWMQGSLIIAGISLMMFAISSIIMFRGSRFADKIQPSTE